MSRGGWWVVLTLAGLAVASRLVLLAALPMAPLEEIAVNGDGDTRYYVRLAQTLQRTGEFAEGHLRAYRPPAYPAFLSFLLHLGASARTLQVVQNLQYLFAVLLLAVVAGQTGGWIGGAVVAAFALASPIWLLLPQVALTETLFVTLVAVGVGFGLGRSRPPLVGVALIAGMTFGLAGLVREVGVLLGGGLALVVGGWEWRRGARFRAILLTATVLIGTVVVISPWTIRNYYVFQRVIPISTNGPINLYLGNNSEATGEYHWRLPPEVVALWNREDQNGSNELFAMDVAGREARAYIRASPGHVLALAPRKLWALWGPPVALHAEFRWSAVGRLGAAVWWFSCLALGVFGMWRMRREPVAWFVAGTCLIGTLVHVATYGGSRYRSAQEYLLMLPAGLVVVDVLRQRAANLRGYSAD